MNAFFFIAFVAASSAFVLTGLKDYLQRDLGLTDRQVIERQIRPNRLQRFDVIGVPDLYGTVDYAPGYPDFATSSRPLCIWHQMEPVPGEPDPVLGELTWIHAPEGDRKTVMS